MKLTEEQEQYIVENCETVDLEEMYDNMLDECYGDIEVCGMAFSSRRILQKLDPTAYRCGMVDYEDSLGLIEIDGDYYMPDDIDKALEDFADLQDEFAEKVFLDEEDEGEEDEEDEDEGEK